MAEKSKSFFDKYASEYDALTDARSREPKHALEISAIISRFDANRVLDAGCATGLSSYLLAKQGVEAVGLDCSRTMIKEARKKYSRKYKRLSFALGRFESLPVGYNKRFDLVVCLANAISGVGSVANLRKSLAGFYRVLRPGGHLLIQALNYGAMKEGVLSPVRVTHRNKIVYQRFSERRGKSLAVYVIRLDMSKTPPVIEPFRHEFDNFSKTMLVAELKQAGYDRIAAFGDLFFDSRFTRESRDLVLLSRRSLR